MYSETVLKMQQKINPLESSGQKVWLKVAKLFDGENCWEDVHLVYDHQTIHHLSKELPSLYFDLSQESPCLITEDDLIMPCLLEGHAHMHLLGNELDFEKRKQQQSQSSAEIFIEAQNRLLNLAKYGLGAVRDGGDAQGIGLQLAEQKSDRVPAYFSPGAGINRQKRYGSFFARPYEEFADADTCVANRFEQGAAHLKMVVSGIIDFQKGAVTAKPQFNAEEIAQFVKSAHTRGLSVMAHASGEEGIRESVWGGVDTLEHGFFMQSEHLEEMFKRGTLWIPTFAPVQCQVDYAKQMGWTPDIVGNLQRILDHHAKMLCQAMAIGVNIVAGSDAGSIGVAHGDGLIYELELMERAGMPTLEVLKSATSKSADFLFPNANVGRLKKGTAARFMHVKNKCLESVKYLKSSRKTIWNGQVYNADEIQKTQF